MKRRHKVALLRLAVTAKRTSRRNPCRSVRTLLGDPSAQAWVNTPKEIDVAKITAELIPIPVPEPGGPGFKVRVDMGDQGVATPTVVTLYHRGEAVGRGLVGQGVVEIIPEVPIARDSLMTAFEQDRALPAQKAVQP